MGAWMRYSQYLNSFVCICYIYIYTIVLCYIVINIVKSNITCNNVMKTHSYRCRFAKIYILTSMLYRWFDIMKICLVLSDLSGYCHPQGVVIAYIPISWPYDLDLWPCKSTGFCTNQICIWVPNFVKTNRQTYKPPDQHTCIFWQVIIHKTRLSTF